MPTTVALVALGLSNGLTLALCLYLWGRVRHLEGVVDGRAHTVTSSTTTTARGPLFQG